MQPESHLCLCTFLTPKFPAAAEEPRAQRLMRAEEEKPLGLAAGILGSQHLGYFKATPQLLDTICQIWDSQGSLGRVQGLQE